MATAITYNEIQALYLGLLDRPADAPGEAYWYGAGTASSSSVAQGIGNFANYYPSDNGLNGKPISSNINGEITNLYTNMLGVTPSSGALVYWAGVFGTDTAQGGMTAGAAIGSIADQIFNIVENLPVGSPYTNDKTTMNDRIATAQSYTQANANVTYSSSAYLAEGQSIITSAAAPTVFYLTTAIDNIAPVGNSEIYGVVSATPSKNTVNSFDKINASGNGNTLNISATEGIDIDNTTNTANAVKSFNVTGVQSAVIEATKSFNVNTTKWSGLNSLNITDAGTTTVTAATGTKGTAVVINDTKSAITVNGGTTVGITAGGTGNVTVGTTTAPTGAVTVVDTGGKGIIAIGGGASATVTSTAGITNSIQVSGVTGTTTVKQTGVFVGTGSTTSNYIYGGTGAKFITTGGTTTAYNNISITLGETGYHQVISGNAAITDTMSGPNNNAMTVYATGAVNINTTADTGTIAVGSSSSAALDPNAVTIVNETATSSGFQYGTATTNVYTNGATSVSITGAGDTTVADEGTANKLASVSLTGVQGTATLTSSILTNVTIDNSLKTDSATVVKVINSTTGHTINLNLSGDTNAGTTLTDNKASTINVTATGASNYIKLTDGLNPASGLTYSFTNNGAGTLNVNPASIANGTNGDVINIAGSGAVALGNLGAKTHLTSITDSGAGAVTATISGQLTNFTGGSGANVIDVTSTAALTHNINGGTGGNNTVIETSAQGDYKPALGATGLTNFQNLALGGGATGTYNTTQGTNNFTGELINYQGSHTVKFTNVATTNQVVLAMTNAATKAVTIVPTSLTSATNTLHLDVNTPSGTASVSANAVVQSENTISIDSIKNASSSANTLAIKDATATANKADAAHTIDITGGGNLTLSYTSSLNATAISAINASTSTGKVSVTGVKTSTKGVTITGGSGKLTANGTTGTANVNAKDVITVGSGGGNITLGYGGAGYESGNGATGSETVNLSSGAVASAIITSADGAKGDQNVTINGFNITTSTKTSDAITFAEGKGVVATTTTTHQSVGADKYTVSNGVITFTGADDVAQQIIDAYSIVNTAGINEVAAFQTTTGSTYVVASGTSAAVLKNSILDLKGVTGVTQMGGATAALHDIVSTNVTGSAGTAYDTNASTTIDDTGHSTQVIGGATLFTANTAVTVNNLAQSAIVAIENPTLTSSVLGRLTTTQVGTAGDNSLALNLETLKVGGSLIIDTVTVTGDNALTINAIHTGTGATTVGHSIVSLVDSGNTLASLTLGGTDVLAIQGIQDTALHTINITDANTVTLGATTALNQTLSITDAAGLAHLYLSGAGDTVNLSANVIDIIHDSGNGLTLATTATGTTINVYGTGTKATGTNAAVTLDSKNVGGNTIDAGANSHITLGTITQTAANTVTAGASSVITLDKHVAADTVLTTITITGDTTGATSSGSYQMTTVNNAADNATPTHGVSIIAASGTTGNTVNLHAINVASAATLSAALDIAAKEDSGFPGLAYVDWFQYGGNTYVFEHVGHSENAMTSSDYVVKLAGIVDLTNLSITNSGIIHI